MIQQLIQRMMGLAPGMSKEAAATQVLSADPFDLMLHMEQVWNAFAPTSQGARTKLLATGAFNTYAPAPNGIPAWDHLGYSYVLENSRAVQIFRRVLREYRSGEGLGIPTIETQRWLDATEALLFGAANPMSPWLSTSAIRPDSESVRRNAYWRFFGLDLAFGTEDNRPPTYDKANAANMGFVGLFEELLFELWQAITNVRNMSGVNASDDDRIYRIAQELQFVLRSRRQQQMLAREELAAATVLGWIELTLSADTSVVTDLKATATNAADRLRLIGERVGLAAHSRSAALFAMCSDLSLLLRTIEAGLVSEPGLAWVLYLTVPPSTSALAQPLGNETRRLITEWAAATGKDLKVRAKPVEVNRRQLAALTAAAAR
ncbi:hypothetical protein AKJ09_06182 [Labilithrix luteola]|uniref:Uncharacterized protein n=1 Tax=Labilithrix luteola TaxID=1391654 RepID=A0A0K1Q156_9BACT|nr:hypothetical protein [Labilithrix luteola]AKU99518.1 hypothetical protein AKJ09_06182 [Labilithrix luteola]